MNDARNDSLFSSFKDAKKENKLTRNFTMDRNSPQNNAISKIFKVDDF